MKLNFKEDPKEWRKSALMTALGVAILSAALRWRHVLSPNAWYAVLGLLLVVALCAWLQPRWFRGWYRFSLRLGFVLSQFIGRAVLLGLFLLVVTPLGWVLRLAGKDPLQLKRPTEAGTFWHKARDCSPLERLF
jgi:Saxitoxin biosynthesis operon protein SxtJ